VKLRLLFILADLEAGGAQRVILTIIRHLNRQIFDPHLGIINKNGPMAGDIPDNVPIHDFRVDKVRYAFPGILRLCRSIKPERVVSTLPHLNLYMLAGRSFLPSYIRLIVREANTPSIRIRYTAHPAIYRLLYQKLYPRADGVICNSKDMQKDLIDHFSLRPDKITVIPNPVDVERIRQTILNGRNPYHNGKRHLVAVGRLNYQKGFDMLLKAFSQALQKSTDLHLTIVGEGPKEGSLKRLAANLGVIDSVTFVGHKDNPFLFMTHADLLISSSRWEGLPNAVLEALACGTPVLAFDCAGGTGEIIREGENGWLVHSEDWASMGEKIVELARGEEWLKLKTDSLLPEEYGCQNVVRRYEELLMKSRSDLT